MKTNQKDDRAAAICAISFFPVCHATGEDHACTCFETLVPSTLSRLISLRMCHEFRTPGIHLLLWIATRKLLGYNPHMIQKLPSAEQNHASWRWSHQDVYPFAAVRAGLILREGSEMMRLVQTSPRGTNLKLWRFGRSFRDI